MGGAAVAEPAAWHPLKPDGESKTPTESRCSHCPTQGPDPARTTSCRLTDSLDEERENLESSNVWASLWSPEDKHWKVPKSRHMLHGEVVGNDFTPMWTSRRLNVHTTGESLSPRLGTHTLTLTMHNSERTMIKFRLTVTVLWKLKHDQGSDSAPQW